MVRLSYNFPYDNQTRAQSKTTSRNLKENYLTKPKKKKKTKQNKTKLITLKFLEYDHKRVADAPARKRKISQETCMLCLVAKKIK